MIESNEPQKSQKIILIFFRKSTMKKIILTFIGVTILVSCKVSKPTEETPKGFFFKMKHKKSDEK